MKNGKLPTRNQKLLLRSHGMSPSEWLVVKDTSEFMEVVSRLGMNAEAVKRMTVYWIMGRSSAQDRRAAGEIGSEKRRQQLRVAVKSSSLPGWVSRSRKV